MPAAVPVFEDDKDRINDATFNWYYLAAGLLGDHKLRAQDIIEGTYHYQRELRIRQKLLIDPYYLR